MSTTKPDSQGKSSESRAITISIMGRDFRVATSSAGEKHMLESVDYLNQRMKEVRDTGKVVGNERIAIMAALSKRNPGSAQAAMCAHITSGLEAAGESPASNRALIHSTESN